MSNIWFCSDLHFGHKNIQKFRPFISSEEDNRNLIKLHWKSVVSKKDDVYVLGDAVFTMETLQDIAELPGYRKYLVRGNHDSLNTSAYLKVFTEVFGLVKYKEFWLSHAPIHPDELRGRVNLHGHVHYSTIRKPFNPAIEVKQEIDPRYLNCCVENLLQIMGRSLISLDEIRQHLSSRL